MRRMIWPERRVMQDREVVQWAMDVLADRAIDAAVSARGKVLSDDEVLSICADAAAGTPPTVAEAVAILADEGRATFAQ